MTEHRALTCRCPACGEATTASFPPDVTAPIQYGPRVTALSLYLTAYQLLPLRRTAELLGDLLGQPVSQATLLAARDRAHSALAPVAEMIRAGLRAAPVLRCDESGCYVAGERWWTHVTSTEALTHYAADAKRGKAAMERIGILDHFAGVAVHDAYGSYLGFGCKHALCNAHHLRELLFLAEEEHEPWAAVMKRLLQEMYAFVERVRQQGADHLEPQDERRFLHRYGRVLAQGFAQHREPPARQAGRRGRFRQSKAKNLLDRLRDRRDEVLRFLMDFRVPFDNNLAERDLRMLKVQQKVSGCFRTKQGADQFARLRGYLSTATKQGVRAYEALQRLCLGAPFLPAVPT